MTHFIMRLARPGRLASAMILLPLLAACAAAQDDGDADPFAEEGYDFGNKPAHKDDARSAYLANIKRYEDDKNVLVLPGLIALRKEKRVEIMAEATGVPAGEVAEFLFVHHTSDHGYEAVLWSYAKPSDVHKALEFIGIKAGKSFNPNELRFWPRGERVILSVSPPDEFAPVRIEQLLFDKTKNETLSEDGFLFTGSFMVPNRKDPARKDYAADVVGAKSIASLYSDPTATLDVPRQAWQSEVYGTLVISEEGGFEDNELLRVIIEPENKNARRLTVDMALRVLPPPAPPAGEETASRGAPSFKLTGAKGEALTDKHDLASVLSAFEKIIRKDGDAYVKVSFDPRVPLSDVRSVSRVLMMIDVDRGIRVEPPETGQFYYKAFIPDPRLAHHQGRLTKPMELRLVSFDGALSGILTTYESVHVEGGARWEVKETKFAIPTPEKLREVLEAEAARRKREGRLAREPQILVFLAGDVPYGQLTKFLDPIMPTHKAIYIFLDMEAR